MVRFQGRFAALASNAVLIAFDRPPAKGLIEAILVASEGVPPRMRSYSELYTGSGISDLAEPSQQFIVQQV